MELVIKGSEDEIKKILQAIGSNQEYQGEEKVYGKNEAIRGTSSPNVSLDKQSMTKSAATLHQTLEKSQGHP
ncbi:hypothetical protein [Lacticaseibacillus pantheris]|uniref:hypothetical protein n=1 Tax=Lacticaseibacillus pantheris TaxID=171523 RepID=UPI00265A13F6|nr:hypothetical protein [Lacticaseibacillus pantheris]WKF85998.1 hypothetical protein QY874_05305 [Lacticaseibacillus pantheris]